MLKNGLVDGTDIGQNTPGVGNFTVLGIKSGTNKRISSVAGVALVAGATTIANTSVTANTIVMPILKTSAGTIGEVSWTTNAGVGFTLTSSNALDTSTYCWILIEALP